MFHTTTERKAVNVHKRLHLVSLRSYSDPNRLLAIIPVLYQQQHEALKIGAQDCLSSDHTDRSIFNDSFKNCKTS